MLFGSTYSNTGSSNLARLLLQDLRQISGLCDDTRGMCLWIRDLGQVARLTQQMPMTLNRLQEGRYLAHKVCPFAGVCVSEPVGVHWQMIYAYTGVSESDISRLGEFVRHIDTKIKCMQEQSITPTRETSRHTPAGRYWR